MSSKPKVLMIVTLDTKAVEAQFVRQTLEAEGVDVRSERRDRAGGRRRGGRQDDPGGSRPSS